MNLYLLSRTDNCLRDTFDEIVVIAENEEDAKTITPDFPNISHRYWWPEPRNIEVKYLGVSAIDERGVVLSSFIT